MIKSLITSAALITLIGCGTTEHKQSGVTVPNDITTAQILDEFIQEAHARGVYPIREYIHVEVVPLVLDREKVYGACSGYADNQIIQIKESITGTKRKITLFHELGHCVLGKFKHSENPDDIMFSPFTYNALENWKASVDKLFNNRDLNWTAITCRNPSEDSSKVK